MLGSNAPSNSFIYSDTCRYYITRAPITHAKSRQTSVKQTATFQYNPGSRDQDNSAWKHKQQRLKPKTFQVSHRPSISTQRWPQVDVSTAQDRKQVSQNSKYCKITSSIHSLLIIRFTVAGDHIVLSIQLSAVWIKLALKILLNT